MTIYIVTNKATGAEITRYASMQVQSSTWPLDRFDHTEFTEGEPVVQPQAVTWTKLEYLRRFTQEERIAIRAAAAQAPALDDYLELLALAEEIRSDDPDIVGALQMLEAAGLIGTGRAQEILNGQ